MTPERWARIEDVFNRAMEVENNHRAAFLRDVCAGDSELIQEVERLLVAQEEGGSFLEKPALEEGARELASDTRQSWIGRRVRTYQILSLLGVGGMGEVYRARDTKLHRDVAIKVLPKAFAQDTDRLRRFELEARALASFNHPYIETIYGFEEVDGERALILELVEGQTLRDRLAAGALRFEEGLHIAHQIAAALEASHEKGILHRDLKPANIKITAAGTVKVLDFGLAKIFLGRRADESNLQTATLDATESGIVMGTPAYMSPEQVRGQAIDQRTDVWAFGCVFYELLAGEQPFAGQTVPDTFVAILEREPHWDALPPSTPDRIQDLLRQCLKKDPELRLPSFREVVHEIERVEAGQPPIRRGAALARTRQSIAVLPLANGSGDPDQDYFAEGMTESLITELAKIRALKVISRTSAARYRNSDKSIPEIGRELGVEVLVEGSASRFGNQLRITVQLIDSRTQEIVWGDSYIRDMADVLIVQRDVTLAIAEQISVQLTPEEKDQFGNARQVDPEAYEAYQRGQFHWSKLTPAELDLALEYFQRARRKEPALGYAGIAAVWVARQQMNFNAPSEAGPRAREAILRAVEANNKFPEVQYILALIKCWVDWDWEAAGDAMERTLSLRPNFAEAHAYYAHFLTIMNRPQDAIRHMELALELDPHNALFRSLYGIVLIFARQFDSAIAELQSAQRTSPGNPVIRRGLFIAFHMKGNFTEALAALKTGYAILGDDEVVAAVERGTDYADALCQAADMLAARARKQYFSPSDIAWLYVGAGKEQEALDWYEMGVEQRDPDIPYIQIPLNQLLHNEPRYQSIVRRLRLPQRDLSESSTTCGSIS